MSAPNGPSPAAAGNSGRIPVWLDCDPGHDDAFALILAAHHPKLELIGVSTVAGNQSVEKARAATAALLFAFVTRNALDVLACAGAAGVEVVQGQGRPLVRPPKACPEIHGDSGLDGPDGGPVLPHCGARPTPGKAAVVMGERIAAWQAAHPTGGNVRLVCTGALTNAALVLLLYPELIPRLEIVIMGGALGLGNTGPVVEFNIQIDPEAARVVFEAGAPLVMVPIEVTHTVLATPAVLERIAVGSGGGGGGGEGTGGGSGGNANGSGGGGGTQGSATFRALMVQLLTFFAATYRDVFGFHAGPPLHDPCAVAYVADPSLFKTELMRVDIETASELSAGQTVCDVWHQTGRPKNCHVARAVDVGRFWDMMTAAIDAAAAASPV